MKINKKLLKNGYKKTLLGAQSGRMSVFLNFTYTQRSTHSRKFTVFGRNVRSISPVLYEGKTFKMFVI